MYVYICIYIYIYIYIYICIYPYAIKQKFMLQLLVFCLLNLVLRTVLTLYKVQNISPIFIVFHIILALYLTKISLVSDDGENALGTPKKKTKKKRFRWLLTDLAY